MFSTYVFSDSHIHHPLLPEWTYRLDLHGNRTWQQMTNMNRNRCHFGTAVYQESEIFVFGGRSLHSSTPDTDEVGVYDIANDSWTVLEDRLGTAYQSTAVAVGDKAYVATSGLANIEIFNLAEKKKEGTVQQIPYGEPRINRDSF